MERRAAPHEEAVRFDAESRVFTLKAGRSMYALRISDAGTLDHLYWGPVLPDDACLLYVERSNVVQPFDPTVIVARGSVATDRDDRRSRSSHFNAALENVEQCVSESKRSIYDMWKEVRGANDGEKTRLAGYKSNFQRRLENMTWRLLGMDKLGDRRYEGHASSVLGDSLVLPHEADPLQGRGEGGGEGGGLRHVASQNSMASDVSDSVPRKLENFFRLDEARARDSAASGMRKTYGSVPQGLNAQANLQPLRMMPGQSMDLTDFGPVGSLEDLEALDLQTGSRSRDEGPSSDRREVHGLMSPRLKPSKGNLPCTASFAALAASEALPGHNEGYDTYTFGKNTSLCEVSDSGTGDFRLPSFAVRYSSDGSTISPLVYDSHRITAGREPMPSPLPHVRECPPPPPGSPAGAPSPPVAATTLVVTMVDQHTGLSVELHFTVMHKLEVIVRRLVVINSTRRPLQRVTLLRLMAATIDFDVALESHWMTQLDGSWARERHVTHSKLIPGVHTFGSMRGTSSHQHTPFLAVSQGGGAPSEDHGEVFGFSLIYSGSFVAEAELTDVGRLRVQLGLQDRCFAWTLEPGESISSPECVCVYSKGGLGRLSRQLHALVRDHIIPPQWRHEPMPVLINTWEAEYFAVTHDSVVAMARAAAKADIDMLVLDDGWFGERNDATSSLGDWEHNPTKFPFGIRGLASDVVAEGLRFGLWIEPEMVSINSRLYRAHPDWCLHVPGRSVSQGRNQLVLDLTRAEVRDHVFEQIAAVIRTSEVSYIKWDMNRHLTEPFSTALPAEQQGEIMHRFCLGVYAIHERFVTEFPHVRFEGCSGGGGRFDLGILFFCAQVWASDNTDPVARMRIQYGTSYIFPALTIGAHYSTAPNHITQGTTRKRTRALVAMCGTFGYELDLRKVPPHELQAMRRQVAAHRLISPVVRNGELYRLWDPFRCDYCAWMYVTLEHAAVFAFNLSSRFWSDLVPRLHLRGLDPNSLYDVTEPLPNNRMQKSGTLEVIHAGCDVYQLGAPRVRMYGATLMAIGIPLRFLTQDDSLMFLLTKCLDEDESDAEAALDTRIAKQPTDFNP